MREVTIPQQTYTEDFLSIEEMPGNRVRVVVGVRTQDGANFDIEKYPFKEYVIQGDDLTELNGPAAEWAPDKPAGTYRNQDLWHFIDKQRNTNA